MSVTPDFLTIKQAAHHVNKSEQTIRRLVKQHALTSHIRIESTPKGDVYLISQTFLADHFSLVSAPIEEVSLTSSGSGQKPELVQLQQLLERRVERFD
jgi:hypothetical protein